MPYWTKLPCKYSSLTPLCNGPTLATRSGDIGFYVTVSGDDSFVFEHTVIVGRSNNLLVHSNKMLGVYTSNLNKHRQAVFFRFKGDPLTALGACDIAHLWSRGHRHSGVQDFEGTTQQRVGFSSAHWKGYRSAIAGLGSCAFGDAARRRLEKYQNRSQLTPKNVICSEMATLLYQLFVIEEDESMGFIKLDAKHSLPGTLALYLFESPFWNLAGRGK
ncbi:hypothetical protein [Endozoicomonas sp. GU-1]|uniref:hypothetical protein n=1 Tax=Endozoicomonas sp. GU-1 TaxID=3009078 RepID=UPI0022B40C8F|nr:hypothetical protein [Endozoicomonas sp. GU-1]WBA81667.1 hypothetical protein O2T12_00335 [Endozoicomonas sp. GU-1]WBA84621.1 hypothetical protein O3276_15145 [Endozoicomonas sp. GU-1]